MIAVVNFCSSTAAGMKDEGVHYKLPLLISLLWSGWRQSAIFTLYFRAAQFKVCDRDREVTQKTLVILLVTVIWPATISWSWSGSGSVMKNTIVNVTQDTFEFVFVTVTVIKKHRSSSTLSAGQKSCADGWKWNQFEGCYYLRIAWTTHKSSQPAQL